MPALALCVAHTLVSVIYVYEVLEDESKGELLQPKCDWMHFLHSERRLPMTTDKIFIYLFFNSRIIFIGQ